MMKQKVFLSQCVENCFFLPCDMQWYTGVLRQALICIGLEIHVQAIYTVSQKTSPFYFCDIFVKFHPILIIFGRNMPQEI